MCGRFYIDEAAGKEIEALVGEISLELRQHLTPRDVCPTQWTPVLAAQGKRISAVSQRWGYPGAGAHGLVFNARVESVFEKPMFRTGIEHSRIVVPAAGFYEWSRSKEKNFFHKSDSPVLFMAGISRRFADGDHFTILTTGANDSMKPVHERMPLILERSQLRDWIFDDERTRELLMQESALLERDCEYEQLSLF